MSWSAIVGHAANIDRFRSYIASGKLASAYLFTGSEGIGKRTFAKKLTQALLCSDRESDSIEPCGRCRSCLLVETDSHPDLIFVERPKDKSFIPVEKFIGDSEHRMQEGLCHDLSLKPYFGGRKIAIIDDADYINKEGANCLLKTLEEPPAGSILILIGTNPQRQLPTIRSRCQWVKFGSLTPEQLQFVLLKNSLADSQQQALTMAQLGSGSIAQAILMRDEGMAEFRLDWLRQLSTLDPGQKNFAQKMIQCTESAGSDATARRDRLRVFAEIAIEYYRNVLLTMMGIDRDRQDDVFEGCVHQAIENFSGDDFRAGQCLARCLDVQSEIATNVNASLLIECWLGDIGRLARNEFVDASYC